MLSSGTLRLKVEDHLHIGREDFPADDSISRRHAELTIQDNNVYVRDLASTNGTWVGNMKLKPNMDYLVRLNEIVTFGDTSLILKLQRFSIQSSFALVLCVAFGSIAVLMGLIAMNVAAGDRFHLAWLDSACPPCEQQVESWMGLQKPEPFRPRIIARRNRVRSPTLKPSSGSSRNAYAGPWTK